ncbi:nucleotidyltransferase substrate binding protein [Marinitoga sp. 38H-ov]|uniref:nucleotidyltransferase substrate binding protein n=1 Tax=Marinitoga sp. 38H-ov TaxID=1755814 RepID=UPI0013E9B549|nr:nucleotidyltransferase substrate binding protein [Marinitoga sp. 38H-ov]KAF2955128.1 nucleotidyltransferase [Marinitoga sp. 38H-ov]
MPLDLSSLEKAINSLDELIKKTNDKEFMDSLDVIFRYGIKAGVIQNFEFTYELCWKFMKRWLEENIGRAYVDGITRKELFRLSYENKLIENIENWFEYHKYRNLTSHTYDLEIAEEVYNISKDFIKDAKILLERLKERND